MPYGPAELIVVGFPENRFRGEIMAALEKLVAGGTIGLIDLLFVTKDEDGTVRSSEVSEMLEVSPRLVELNHDSRLMSDEDVELIAEELEPGSSAGLMLFEHLWAAALVDAIRNAGGELIYQERIPASVVEEVADAAAI